MMFIVPGNPMGKPRMTRSDKWKKRDCVMRFRAWADETRLRAGKLPKSPLVLSVTAYFDIPESYSKNKKLELTSQAHRVKPDCDNILKGVSDALLKNDSCISFMKCQKFWNDGKGARIEVEIF